MSVGQEHDSGADDPDLIRLNKRSLFTPSASVAVEQHSAVPHVSRSTYGTAKVEGRLTSPNARVPEIITQRCGGITVKGHTLKSVRLYHRCGDYPQHERERHPRGVPFHRRTGDHAGAAHRGADAAVRRRGWRHHHRSACGRAGHGGGDAGRGRRGHQRSGTGGNHRNDHVDGGHPCHRHGHGG